MAECESCREMHGGADAEYCPPCLVRLLRADLAAARGEVGRLERRATGGGKGRRVPACGRVGPTGPL